ncbi:MAG: TolC family protein [Spirochaetia bacterium]|jgi:outer membrane protein TolC|nr:TolC family protein [Spirochaetia bacterium]
MKKILSVLGFSFILITIISAETVILDIDKSVELALGNNLGLKSSRIDVEMKKRTTDHSWNNFIPTVQASANLMRWNTEQIAGIPGFEVALDRWNLSTGLDISLNLSYALFKEMEGTKLDYEAGLITYEIALKQLERDVRKNFYNILVYEENLWLMEQNIEAANSRFEQAKINYKNGLVPELTVLSAQVGYENLKPALTEMNLGYETMKDGFKILLGIDLSEDITLEGDIVINPVSLDTEKLTNYFLGARLDIQSMNKSVQSLENAKSTLKLQTMTPMLILGLNFDPTFQADPWENNWFENMGDNWSQQSGMFRMTLAMSLDPFLPWSKTQTGIKDMEDGITQLKLGITQARIGAEMEIKTLVMKLNKSMEQLETLILNISLAHEAYRMSQEAYDSGSRELLEVKDAERDLNTAKLEVLKEKYNYITGLLDLEYALNASLEEIKEISNE